jgi:radical SAM protein with 4Fe4S-binding SPASM domain
MTENTIPTWIQIHPTLRCNLHCYFCKNPQIVSKELSDRKLLSLVEEAGIFGIKNIIITGGGEPFMRMKLTLEMMKKAKKYGMNGCVITNGTIMCSHVAKQIVKMGWDTFLISLHSSSQTLDRFIRGGKNAFKNTITTIKEINFWKEKFYSRKPTLGFIFVVTKDNYHEIEDMPRLAKKFGVEQINIKLVNENPHLSIEKSQFYLFLSKIHKTVKLSQQKKVNLILEFSLEEIKKLFQNKKNFIKKPQQIPCKIPFTEIVVFADGTTSQCCYFWGKKNEFIDDIRSKSLKEVWYGEKFENLRRKIEIGDFPSQCKNCMKEWQYARK